MAIKRLRRMKDGQIYGYSDAMAATLGMEIVMVDEISGEVVEELGEVGELGVYGRNYVGNKVYSDEPKKPDPDPEGLLAQAGDLELDAAVAATVAEVSESTSTD